MSTKGAHNLQNQEIMKDNKTRQIAILERILSYAEFKKKHLPMLELLADKLKKLKDEKI
jgi:hypothetical protein